MSEILGYQPEQSSLSPELESQGLGIIVVITGRSGAGKDMVKNGLQEDPDLNLPAIVTYTDRLPRTGEVDGVDYHFIPPEEFTQKIEEGFFAEYVQTGKSMKGTSKAPFENIFKGLSTIWRIDISRAATLLEFYTEVFGEDKGKVLEKQTIVTYIDINDKEVLEERSRLRDPDNYDPNEFELRYENETQQLNLYRDRFQHIIPNDRAPEETLLQVKQVIFDRFA